MLLITPSSPDEVVTIYIGKEKKAFIIHKEIACLHSPVLRAAFSSKSVKEQTKTYTLNGTIASAFQLLVQRLYSQKLKPLLPQPELDSIPTHHGLKISTFALKHKILNHQHNLAHLWSLSSHLHIPHLRNLVIDELEAIRQEWGIVASHLLHWLYENLPRGAGLRELVREQCRCFLPGDVFERHGYLFPGEMLVECLLLERGESGVGDVFGDRGVFERRFYVPVDGEEWLKSED
jgi:hypothetical protein